MRFSNEQLAVINCDYGRVKVLAGAGAGKTTVVREWCARRPGLNILFLVYARLMADDARASFPANVTCKTFHGLAVGELRGRRVGPSGLTLKKIAGILGVMDVPLLQRVLDCLAEFVLSDDPWPVSVDLNVSRLANDVWSAVLRDDNIVISFDEALKIYSLNCDLSSYDAVIVDEAQDQNKAKEFIIASYIANKPDGRVLLIGDRDQQINRWNGAVNALDSNYFSDFKTLRLQESYRFGPEVATIANDILRCKKGWGGAPIIGLKDKTKLFIDVTRDFLPQSNARRFGFNHVAYLCRSIKGCLELGFKLAMAGHKIYWVGGLDTYRIRDLCNLWFLVNDRWDDIEDRYFALKYKDFESYKRINKLEGGDSWIEKSLRHFDNPAHLLECLERASVDSESMSTATLSTVSRCKGFGWDVVYINNDFGDILRPGKDRDKHEEEVNLAYVGVTRAKSVLIFADGYLSHLAELSYERKRSCVG